MVTKSVILLVAVVSAVVCLPLENAENTEINNESTSKLAAVETTRLVEARSAQAHKLYRRFINPFFGLGLPNTDNIAKMRTKRSYDECEKLQLCKLHARSGQSFFAAYELYFVNKENARLWDHHARSMAECESRYGDCYYK